MEESSISINECVSTLGVLAYRKGFKETFLIQKKLQEASSESLGNVNRLNVAVSSE